MSNKHAERIGFADWTRKDEPTTHRRVDATREIEFGNVPVGQSIRGVKTRQDRSRPSITVSGRPIEITDKNDRKPQRNPRTISSSKRTPGSWPDTDRVRRSVFFFAYLFDRPKCRRSETRLNERRIVARTFDTGRRRMITFSFGFRSSSFLFPLPLFF